MDQNDEPLPDATRINMLAGRVEGLKAIMLSLVKSHPDPGALLLELRQVEQAALARNEATSPSDLFLDEMRDMIETAQRIARRRV